MNFNFISFKHAYNSDADAGRKTGFMKTMMKIARMNLLRDEYPHQVNK